MSSSNLSLYSSYPPMAIVLQWSSSVSCMVFSRKMLNIVGNKIHPYRTPTDIFKNIPVLLLTKMEMFFFNKDF